MAQNEIIALRCPSCGGSPSEPSREMPFGAEFRCNHCGVTSVIIIDKALVPLSTLMKQGEKVCTKCGRMEMREARFCQEGHPLVKHCFFDDCRESFSVDHQRCDYCGKLYVALQLNEVYQGTVKSPQSDWAEVEIIPGFVTAFLDREEIANHPIGKVSEELKEGEQIMVKIIKIDGIGIWVSSKALGRP